MSRSTIQGGRTLQYPCQHNMLGKRSSCCSPPLRSLTLCSGRPCWAKAMTQSVENSGHCISSSLRAQSMMRACTRHNLVESPAPLPGLIPVKPVEAFLQCFGAAEKSMNHKNSKSNGLRNSDLSWGWCLKPGHSSVVRHSSWFPRGSTWLLILLAWPRFFALRSKDDEGTGLTKPLTRSKISVISQLQKCFSELKISKPRISCTLNGARRSSWKVLWVTKTSYTSETSFR